MFHKAKCWCTASYLFLLVILNHLPKVESKKHEKGLSELMDVSHDGFLVGDNYY